MLKTKLPKVWFRGNRLKRAKTGDEFVAGRGYLPLMALILMLVMVLAAAAGVLPGCKKKTITTAPAPVPSKAPAPKAPEAKAPEAAEKPKETVAYTAGGRRDPFKPLVVTKAPGEKVKGDPKKALDVGDLKLVGIVWDKRGFYYALVETPQGLGYTLRPNDQVGMNAVVQKITQEEVRFQVKTRPYAGVKGETSEVVLKLRKEE